jgi:GTP-binding protein
MLDYELIREVKKTLPENVPSVFISSISNKGLMELKDKIWNALNDEW